MNDEQQTQQPSDALARLTPQGKKALLAGLMAYPALTVQAFIRDRTGFRHLKPGKVIFLAALMLVFGYFVDGPATRGRAARGPATAAYQAPALPAPTTRSNIPPGFDAAPPTNRRALSPSERNAWIQRHRLTQEQYERQQEQRQEEQQRAQAQAQAEAQSVAKWQSVRAYLARWPMIAFALAFLVYGLIQRRARWKDLLAGVRWHTYSRGVPYLKPILGRSLPETYILRFADPLCVFLAGAAALPFSRALGCWLMFSAFALFIVEQYVFDVQLERELDMLDNLVDAESITQSYRHWKKDPKEAASSPALSIEENGGVLSTAAIVPDLLEKRKDRRSKLHKATDAYIERIEREMEAQRQPEISVPAKGATRVPALAPSGDDTL